MWKLVIEMGLRAAFVSVNMKPRSLACAGLLLLPWACTEGESSKGDALSPTGPTDVPGGAGMPGAVDTSGVAPGPVVSAPTPGPTPVGAGGQPPAPNSTGIV